jgi:hypothetical protein
LAIWLFAIATLCMSLALYFWFKSFRIPIN